MSGSELVTNSTYLYGAQEWADKLNLSMRYVSLVYMLDVAAFHGSYDGITIDVELSNLEVESPVMIHSSRWMVVYYDGVRWMVRK